MKIVREFWKINKADVSLVGGKGASLGEMTQVGIPVPPGFVVLSPVFHDLIVAAGIDAVIIELLATLNHEDASAVDQVSRDIRALILKLDIPENIVTEIQNAFQELNTEFVAVRSSATAEDGANAAWAGQLDTYLYATQHTLIDNVRQCWASLFTPRAIFYRVEQGMRDTTVSVAVIVQKMVNADTAGVAFSVHPVTQDRNSMIIEGAYGLGEAVVGGSVTPDSVLLTKQPLAIAEKMIAAQNRKLVRATTGGVEWVKIDLTTEQVAQKITNEQLIELGAMVTLIEQHYGFPVDVEWAFEQDTLAILQSRPITTLQSTVADNPVKESITLTKIFSREHSLFYASIWFISDTTRIQRWIDHIPKNILFLRESNTNKLSIWYEQSEVQAISNSIRQKIIANPQFLPRLIQESDQAFEQLQQWCDNPASIQRVQDMKDFHQQWLNWWCTMAIYFDVVEMSGLPQEQYDLAESRRTITQDYTEKVDTVYIEAFQRLAPQFADLAYVVFPDEAISLIVGEHDSKMIALINRRLSGYAYLNGEMYEQPEIQVALQQAGLRLDNEQINSTNNTLTGTSASPGFVTGRVRKILLKEDLSTMQVGEVLVSEMTTPDFVSAMKMAAAIVTDEGGMMSHAAIIARELHKPTVIGTKHATQLLNTGDEVEVDAINGIVRFKI